MPVRPRNVSRSPIQHDLRDTRSDVLADVIGATVKDALYKRIECRAPWGIQTATHERAVFYVVARGTALLEVEGEAPITLAAGDLALVSHGTGHTLRDSPRTTPTAVCGGQHHRHHHDPGGARKIGGAGAASTIIAGFFEFVGGRKPPLLDRLPRLVTVSSADPAFQPWLSSTVQLIVTESTSPGPASTLVIQRLADVLFVHTLRTLATHTDCPSHGLPALVDPHIRDALGILHGHITEEWTVARLAARVGLSRSGFAARFADLVGEPPLHYLARWRMARAAELLRGTDDGLAAIAARVGYESVPSFSKAFKRWRGESPGAFRRKHAPPASPTA